MDFIHPLLNEEIDSIAGHYTITKEEILPHEKGPILYLVGFACMDTSCCGYKGCSYAIVAGHIEELRCGRSEDGRIMSKVFPVSEDLHEEITGRICRKEGTSQVHITLPSGEKKIMYQV